MYQKFVAEITRTVEAELFSYIADKGKHDYGTLVA